jgi:hypothetical protein
LRSASWLTEECLQINKDKEPRIEVFDLSALIKKVSVAVCARACARACMRAYVSVYIWMWMWVRMGVCMVAVSACVRVRVSCVAMRR